MPLETGTFISDFNASNPAHSDGVVQGDSHLRWIKQAILNTFTGVTGAVTATHTQINSAVAAVVTGTQAALHFAGTVGAPGVTFVGNTACGLYASGTNAIALVTSGVAALTVNAAGAIATVGALAAGGALSGATVSSTGAYAGGTGQLGIVGEPRLWLADTLPSGNFGWLNGAAISRTGNPVLFALWGTKYGAGDGSTTFNLPNFQEVVPIGKNGMGGASGPGLIAASGVNANIGITGDIIGEGAHTLVVGEIPAHTHSGTTGIESQKHTHSPPAGSTHWSNVLNNQAGYTTSNPGGLSDGGTSATTTDSVDHTHPFTTDNGTGGGGSHNIVQSAIVCNWITLLG